MREIIWAAYWEIRGELNNGEATVWLDVSKADMCWPKDHLYIPGGAPEHLWKYNKFGDWLAETTGRVEMPHVSIDENGMLGFSDGRHRFAWMRDHGAKAIPVTICEQQAPILCRLAGTDLRECRI